MPREKEKAPAYQWYPKDYDTDEAVKLMTYEQEGIYRRLLDHQWLHGSIPSDPNRISGLVPKVPRVKFLKLWPGMSEKFIQIGDERLANGRLERSRSEFSNYIATQSQNGANGAAKRWGKLQSSDAIAAPLAPPLATPSPTDSSSTATSSATSKDSVRVHVPTGSGVMGGSLPRDHRGHAFCGRKCVPDFLHAEFKAALGGDPSDADVTLRGRNLMGGWYGEIEAAIPPGPIGDEPLKFWRAHFAAAFPSGRPAAVKSTAKFTTPDADETAKKYLRGAQ